MRRGALVVMVEDHRLHALLLRRALEACLPGVEIEHFEDGLAARRRLEDSARTTPDLLVLDLACPGRTGHELLGDRAGDARLRRVPAAVVTSSVDERDRHRSLALGADLHLAKPQDSAGFTALAGQLADLVGARASVAEPRP